MRLFSVVFVYIEVKYSEVCRCKSLKTFEVSQKHSHIFFNIFLKMLLF